MEKEHPPFIPLEYHFKYCKLIKFWLSMVGQSIAKLQFSSSFSNFKIVFNNCPIPKEVPQNFRDSRKT
jgi:hypothetical protein